MCASVWGGGFGKGKGCGCVCTLVVTFGYKNDQYMRLPILITDLQIIVKWGKDTPVD